MSRLNRRWNSLWGFSKSTETARQQARNRRRTRKLFMEPLEDRRLLATFAGSAGNPLLLDLNTAGEEMSSVAGATHYTLMLVTTGATWAGTDVPGQVVGNGTDTLTVTKDVFASLDFSDSAAGTTVLLRDSGSEVYTDPYNIVLDDSPAIPALNITGNSSFGNNDLFAQTATQISVTSGGQLTTIDGNINLSANAAGTATGNFPGIQVQATIQSTGSGQITLVGRGAGVGNDLVGVIVEGGIILGGSGTVTVNGTGSPGAGERNFGVQVVGVPAVIGSGVIGSAGGDVIVTGEAGGSTLAFGVVLTRNGKITAGGAGSVSVTGTAGMISGGQGVVLEQTGGQITADGTGAVSVNGTGGMTPGEQPNGVEIQGSSSKITSGGGAVTVIGQGGDSGTLRTSVGVNLDEGGEISAGGMGTVTVNGTSGPGTGNDHLGVNLENDSRITSVGGAVTVTGNGGGSPGGPINTGVRIRSDSEVTAGGMGTVSVSGTGGLGQGSGVQVRDDARITSGGGAVTVIGQGAAIGNGNHGVEVVAGGEITSGGAGTVNVTGTGGVGSISWGVVVDGRIEVARITSGGGAVTVSGQGGGSGGSANGYGVYVHRSGEITAGVAGTVSVTGTGGSGTGARNSGVVVEDAGSAITTGAGNGSVTITGTAGNGSQQFGVSILGGGAVTTVGGAILINGQKSSGGLSGDVQLNGPVTSAGADITIGADRDIVGDTNGDLSTGAGGGNIGLTADQDTTGTPNDAGTIQLAGDVTAGTGTVTLSLTDTDGKLDGNVVSAGNVIKSGPGTLTMNGAANAYAGTTNVNAGTLLVDGDVTGSGAVAVNSGGTLGGTGSLAGAVTVHTGGTITGGTMTTVETLTVGGLSFDGGTYHADLAGLKSDTIATAGVVDLQATAQGVFDLDVSGAGTAQGTIYTLINNTGAGAIVDPPLQNAAEGGSVTVNGETGTYTYLGGTGNDFTMTLAPAQLVTYTGTAANENFQLIRTATHIELYSAASITVAGNDAIIVSSPSLLQSWPVGAVEFVVIDGNGGSDSLAIDYAASTGLEDIDVSFGGGGPGTDSALYLRGGTFGKVVYDYLDANDGFIENYDAAGTSLRSLIFYAGLAPITNTGTVTDIVFNLPTSGNVQAILEDDGSAINTLSRLRSNPVAFEQTDFANPSGSVTINRGDATDDLTINNLNNFTAGLTIGDGVHPLDQLTVAGNVTLAADKNLTVDATTIDFNSTPGRVVLSGNGAARLTADHWIGFSAGSRLTSVNGDIDLSANAAGTATGDFTGIRVNLGRIESTGSGAVTLTGRGSGTGNQRFGVDIRAGGSVLGGAGTVTVTGTGGTGPGQDQTGVRVADESRIFSAGGDVVVTGQGGNSGGQDSQGVRVEKGGEILAGGTGAVSVTGTAGAGPGNSHVGVLVVGSFDDFGIVQPSRIGSADGDVTVVGTGGGGAGVDNSGVVVYRANSAITSGAGSVSITGTAGGGTGQFGVSLRKDSFELVPRGGAVSTGGGTILIDGVKSSGGLSGDVQIEGPVTSLGADITVRADRDIVGDANGDISSGTGGGNIVISANRDTTGTPNDAGTIQTGGDLTAGTGTVTLDLTDTDGVLSGNIVSAGNVIKEGPGTLTLTGGANAYSGTTNVDAGTLLVEGTISGTGAVSVNTGSTLGGTGSIGGTVTVNTGGTITGGTVGSVGTLTVGGLSFNGGMYDADLLNNTSDRITTAGAVDLDTGTPGVFSLNVITPGAVSDGNVYRLINNTGAGGIADTFSGVNEGDSVTVYTPNDGTYSYVGGVGGNDFVISIQGAGVVGDSGTAADENFWLVKRDDGGTEVITLYIGVTINFAAGAITVSGGSILNQWDAVDSGGNPVTFVAVDGGGGNDKLVVDYTGLDGLEDVNVAFQGGGAGSGSELFVKGGDENPDFGKVVYEYIDAHNGLIENFSDAAGTTLQSFTLYLGLDPITSTVNATNVVLDYTGGAETITVTPDATPGFTNAVSTLGENTTFKNPTGSLTVQTGNGSGADTVNIEGVGSGFDADLTIDADNDDTLSFQTTATDIGNGNLTADAKAINVTAAVSTATTGAISLTTTENIVVSGAGSITTADGDITLSANATGTATGDFTGIEVDGATVQSTGSGAISLTGRGGSSVSPVRGVSIRSGGEISASGTGSISVIGTGGSGGGVGNVGVFVSGLNSKIESAGGDVSVSGTGGLSSGANAHGVNVLSGGLIQAGSSGAVTVTGIGGSGAGSANVGVLVDTNSQILGAVSGPVTVTGTGGSGSGNLQNGVLVQNGGSITSNGGDVAVTGQGGGSGAAGQAVGVVVSTNAAPTTISAGGNGSVTVTGIGGGGEGDDNFGVGVAGAGASITSGPGGGDVTVTGQGGGSAGSQRNYGVFMSTGGQITSGAGGNVAVTGTGGDSFGLGNRGVLVTDTGTQITSGGGSVTVTGLGGGSLDSSFNVGVEVNGSGQITSGGSGNVVVTGTGGPSTGNGNAGVQVSTAGVITAGGSGTVTVSGTGGSGMGGSFKDGVRVQGTDSRIRSSGGAVTVTGHAGENSDMQSNGVFLAFGGRITSGGSGPVTVNGFGATNALDFGNGVLLQDGGVITSNGGNVAVTGQGGGSGATGNSVGVVVFSTGPLTDITTGASGGATLTVTGTGGGGAGSDNSGVVVFGANAFIRTAPGAGGVTITGTAGGGTGQFGVSLRNGGQVETTDGTILIDGKKSSPGGLSGDIQLNGPVTSSGADITIRSDRDIVGDANGVVSTDAFAGRNIVMTADQDTTGTPNDAGAIQTAGDVTAGTGTVTLSLTDCDGFMNGNLVSASDVIKEGSGALRLNGAANSYSGTTNVNAGTLLVNGALTADDDTVHVNNGGTLGGTGTIGTTPGARDVIVHSGGTLDPGDLDPTTCTPLLGRLTVNGDVTIEQGGTLRVQVNGTTPATDYDQLRVNGQVDLTGDPAGNNGGALLVQPGFTIPLGSQFVIIDNNLTDPIDTRFLGLPEGALLPLSGTLVHISYRSGDGNDVTLSYQQGTVTGRKFHDQQADGFTGDGADDDTDPGLGNWQIFAFADLNGNGQLDTEDLANGVVASDTTDNTTGEYELKLNPGDYLILEVTQGDWSQSFPASSVNTLSTTLGQFGYAITLQSGETVSGNDFGNYRQATFSGRKFEDQQADGFTGDGADDDTDPGLGNWQIFAFADVSGNGQLDTEDLANGIIASDTTDNTTGEYELTLDPGDYLILEVIQGDWSQSFPASSVNTLSTTLGQFGYAITLQSGDAETGNDFGNYRQAEVGGMKYEDFNADGVMNGNDAGLDDWTITAFVDANSDGELQLSEINAGAASFDVTDASGGYALNLVPGDYIIVETAKLGWLESPDADTTEVNPGELSGFGRYGYAITVQSGEIVGDNDFGNYQFARTSGMKYEDLNADRVLNGSDAGLEGWRITAFVDANGDGELQQNEIDAGAANFDVTEVGDGYNLNLVPGDYILVETAKVDWFESPDAGTTEVNPFSLGNFGNYGYAVTLQSGETVSGNDFGNYRAATKTGMKYEDLNGDGIKDAGEPGLQGWQITAFQDLNGNGTLEQNEIINGPDQVRVTDTNGDYSFRLKPGPYIVVETLQAGYFESPDADTTEVNAGALGGFGRHGYAVTLQSGEDDRGNDFGNFRQGTITGLKYLDHNRDGVQDGIDKGLQKWTITAFVDADGDGVLQQAEIDAGEAASITTGSDGTYSLTLDPGDYILVETVKAGWRESPDADATLVNPDDLGGFGQYGYAVSLTSNGLEDSNDFANFRPDSITVIKNAVPNFAQDFCFTVTGGGLTPFCLDDDSDPTLSDSITFEGLEPGTYTITETAVSGWLLTNVTIQGGSGSSVTDSTATVTLESGENAVVVFTNVRQGIIVIGPDKSPLVEQVVKVIDADSGTVLNSFLPYERDFIGGVHVATGDVDGDGIDEIITAPRRGRAPELRIFEQTVANIAPNPSVPLQSFLAYDPSFSYGFNLSVADVNGDGWADLVTVPNYGTSDVKVFLNSQNPAAPFDPANPALVKTFRAFSTTSSIGGWVVATDDMGQLASPAQAFHATSNPFVNKLDATPRKAEIIVGTGPGLVAQVRVFTMNPDGSFAVVQTLNPLTAISSAFYGGVVLETARINGDEFPDVLVGAGINGESRVEAYVWNGSATNATLTTPPLLSFAAYTDPTKNQAVHLAAEDQNGDGIADIVFVVQGSEKTSGQIHSFDIDGTAVPPTVQQPPTVVPGTYPAGYFIATIQLPDENLGAGQGPIVNPLRPGQNPVLAPDVNADGLVQPVDALTVINSLHESGEGEAILASPVPGALPPYLDVSGDNRVTPLDVLLVINHLNRYLGGEGEYVSGEGESSGGEGEYVAAALAGEGEYVVPVDAAAPLFRMVTSAPAAATAAPVDTAVDAVWWETGTTGNGAAEAADLPGLEDSFSAGLSDEDDFSDWDAVLSVLADDEGWMESV
jgi:hypothetical protein